MKKYLIFIFILVIGLTNCQDKKQIPVSAIYNYMPHNTIFFVKLSSIKKTLKTISADKNKIFGHNIEKELKKTQKTSGINPLNITELQKTGLDINKEYGLFISNFKKNKNYSANVTLFFPTKNPGLFIKKVQDIISKEEKNIKWHTKSGIIYSLQAKNDIAITEKNDIVFITIKENKLEPKKVIEKETKKEAEKKIEIKTKSNQEINDFLDSLKIKKSLWETPSFKNAASKINTNEDLSFFINFKQVFTKSNLDNLKTILPEKEKKARDQLLKMFKDYNEFLCTIDFDSKDLLIKYLLQIRKGSKIAKLYNFKFDKNPLLRVSKMPILLIAAGINFIEYEKYINNLLKASQTIKYDEFYKKFKQETGFDLKEDIISNLAGSINYAFFDGKTCNMFNINGFLSIAIKNEKKMNKVIDNLIAKLTKKFQIPVLEEKIDSINVKALNIQFYKIYYLVYKKNLIITTNKEYVTNIISGSTSSGFTAKMEKDLAEKLKKEIFNFYWDFNQTSMAIDSFLAGRPAGSMPEADKIKKSLSKLNYLLYNTYYKDNILFGDLKLKTKFSRPFIIELTETINKIIQEENAKKLLKEPEKKSNNL